MNGSRLALVADDPRLASAIQAHLKKTLGQSVFHCTLASIHHYLSRDSEGLLLLATASAAQSEQVMHLVQEVYLQKLPPIIMIVEGAEAVEGPDLDCLEPYVAHRLHWPKDAARLTNLVRERAGRIRDFCNGQPESLEDVIDRRLLVQTPSLLPLVERIALAATHDVTVLLTGETGPGKTHLARLMHDCSPRRSEPFLTVPCGAIPANLVESEFFGHVKGAFTGADRAQGRQVRGGRQRHASCSTRSTRWPLEQQASLLRVIETGEFEPVGSNETQHCTARHHRGQQLGPGRGGRAGASSARTCTTGST